MAVLLISIHESGHKKRRKGTTSPLFLPLQSLSCRTFRRDRTAASPGLEALRTVCGPASSLCSVALCLIPFPVGVAGAGQSVLVSSVLSQWVLSFAQGQPCKSNSSLFPPSPLCGSHPPLSPVPVTNKLLIKVPLRVCPGTWLLRVSLVPGLISVVLMVAG